MRRSRPDASGERSPTGRRPGETRPAVRRRSVLAILLAAAAGFWGCDSSPQSPATQGTAGVTVVAELSSSTADASRQAAFRQATEVQVRVRRSSTGETVVDRVVEFDAEQGAAELSVQVTLEQPSARFAVDLEVRRDGDALFGGEAEVTLTAGKSTSAEIQLRPIPAGVNVRTESPVEMTALGDTLRVEADVVFATGDPIPSFRPAWSSGTPSVATVTTDGLVTAESPGETVLVAAYESLADSLLVRVDPLVASVTVTPDSTDVPETDTAHFEASVVDDNGNTVADADAAWSSTDTSVATVDQSGVATARDDGNTGIVASASGVADTATLVVTPLISTVDVRPDSATVDAVGDTADFDATLIDATGDTVPGATATWRSDDSEVASVDSTGLATAVGDGSARIIATSSDGAADTALFTVDQQVASVTVTPDSTTISENDTAHFEATVEDDNGNTVADADAAWSSTDTSVATVDQSGVATARDDGNTGIVASASGVADTATLVVESTVSGVDVSPNSATVDAFDETTDFDATLVDATGDPLEGGSFTWSSSNTEVATVDSTGLATSQSNGTSEIVATSSEGYADTAAFTVDQQVSSVNVDPDSTSIFVGDTANFDATAQDHNGFTISGTDFAWSSSDTSVATVDSTGEAIGESSGSAMIIATASGVADSADLTVEALGMRPRPDSGPVYVLRRARSTGHDGSGFSGPRVAILRRQSSRDGRRAPRVLFPLP